MSYQNQPNQHLALKINRESYWLYAAAKTTNDRLEYDINILVVVPRAPRGILEQTVHLNMDQFRKDAERGYEETSLHIPVDVLGEEFVLQLHVSRTTEGKEYPWIDRSHSILPHLLQRTSIPPGSLLTSSLVPIAVPATSSAESLASSTDLRAGTPHLPPRAHIRVSTREPLRKRPFSDKEWDKFHSFDEEDLALDRTLRRPPTRRSPHPFYLVRTRLRASSNHTAYPSHPSPVGIGDRRGRVPWRPKDAASRPRYFIVVRLGHHQHLPPLYAHPQKAIP